MSHLSRGLPIALLAATLGMIVCVAKQVPAQGKVSTATFQPGSTRSLDDAASARAFESIVPVLRHPRCINCHSQGDSPRQGDDSHPTP